MGKSKSAAAAAAAPAKSAAAAPSSPTLTSRSSKRSPSSPSSSSSSGSSSSSSDSDSDSDELNIITADNYGQKKSIAALSAKEVLAAAEEQRKKQALLDGDSDEESEEEEVAKSSKSKKSAAASKSSLLESSDDEEGESLKINKEFAAKFESEKRQAILSKKASRGDSLSALLREAAVNGSDVDSDGDDELLADAKAQLKQQQAKQAKGASKSDDEDDESGSDEDDDGMLLTKELNAKINQTLQAIREKKPEVYDPSKSFFTEEEMERIKAEKKAEKERMAKKGQTVQQLMAQELLKKKDPLAADASDSDSDSDSDAEADAKNSRARLQELADRPATLTYTEQQKKLKEDFLKSVESEDEGDEDVFRVKKRVSPDSDDDDAESADKKPSSASSAAAAINTSDATAFLNAYVNEEWWREKDLTKLPSYRDIKGEDLPEEVSASEDEEALDAMDTYEAAYNFRFEEPDAAYQIKTYPRQIEDTLRKKDSKRKLQREAAKKHKEEERLRKKEEIKRLKAEKRKDLTKKLKELESISGLGEETVTSSLSIHDLLNNWDPEKHDELMAKMFGEDTYYADAAEDENMDEEQLREIALQGEDLAGLGMGKLPMEGDKKSKKKKGKKAHLDEATLEKVESLSKDLKKGVDEMQQLDFEDLVGTGKDLAPTRFKYRQVEPDSFGFSIQELLELPDAVLNSKVSLKKLAPYRQDKDEMDYQMPHKRKREERMQKFNQKMDRKEQWKNKHMKGREGGAAAQTDKQSGSNKKPQQQQQQQQQKKPQAAAAAQPAAAAAASSSSSNGPSTGDDSEKGLTASQKRRLRKKKLEQLAAQQAEQGAAKKQKTEA